MIETSPLSSHFLPFFPKELFQLTCSVFSQFVDDAPATATEKDKAALLSEPSPVVVQDVVPAPEPSTSRSVKEVSFDIPASPRQEPTPGPLELGDDEPLLTPTKPSKKSKGAKKASVSAPDSWVPAEAPAADPSTTPRGGDAIGDASPTVLAVQEASEQQAAVEPPAPATDVVPPDQAALDSASGGEPTGGHHTEAGPAVGPQHPEDPDAVDDGPSTSRGVAADAEAPKEAKKGLFASSSALPSFRLGSFFSLKKKPQLDTERAESSEATTTVEESSGRDDATPIPVPPSLVVSGQLDEPRVLSPGPAEPGPNVEPLQGSQELVARDKSVDDTTGGALDTAVSQPDERVEGPVGSTPDLTLTDTIASVLEVGSRRDLHADDSLHQQQQQPSPLEQEIDAAPVVIAASDQIIEGDSTPTANESSAAMDRDQDVGATKKKGKKSKAKQRQTTEDEPIDVPPFEAVAAVEPEPVVVEEPVVAEDGALVESGAKKAKKGKKKKQSAAVPAEPESPAEALVVEEQLAAPDVSEPVISEASPEVSNVVDAVAVEASEPTSALETPLVAEAQEGESAVPASKKSKKKKKKQDSAVSDDSEPPLATTSEVQGQVVAEDASAPVIAEEPQVVEAAPVEAPESSVQELPEVDEAAPVAKKSKKNKKKKQGSVVLDEPELPAVDSGDVGDEAVVSETSREVAVPSELEVAPVEADEAAVVEGSEPVSEPLAVEVSEPVSEPAAVEVPEDESALPSSKKSKKDKKKKKQQDAAEVSEPSVVETAPESPAVETPGAADLEPATPVEVAVPEQPVEEVALEQPVEEEAVREEAVQEEVVEGDLLSQPVAGKKGKKDKKKKKQAALDGSSDPAPVEEPVQETALEPEVSASIGTRSNENENEKRLTDEQAIVEKEISPLEESAPQEEQEPAPDAPPLVDEPSQQDTAEPGSSTKKGKKNKNRKNSIQSPTPTSVAIEEPLPVEEPEHIAPAPVPSSSERNIPPTEEEPLPSEAMASDPVGLDAIPSDPVLCPSEAGTSTQPDPANEGTVEIPETEAVDTTPGSKKAKKKKKKSKASESSVEEPVPDNEAVVSAAADEPTPAVEPISSTAEVKDESEPPSEAQLDKALSEEPVSWPHSSASRHVSDKWQVEVMVETPSGEPLAVESGTAPSEEPVSQAINPFTVGRTLTANRILWLSRRSQPLPPDRSRPAQSSPPSPKRARRRNGAVLLLPSPSRNTRSTLTTCWTTPPSPVWKRASPTRPAGRRRIRLSAP